MNPINPSFPNNPNAVAAPQFPGSVSNTQYPGYTFYEGQYQPQQAPEGYQWGYSAVNQGEVPPPLPPSEDLPKPPPENQTYWYKIADTILRNSAFTCTCILTCRFLCFSSYTFSLLESVIFFDWFRLILSYANVLIIQRQAYLLKMKILCKTVYLVSFLLEIKVLNLKACTCTYIFKCFEHCCHFVHLLYIFSN